MDRKSCKDKNTTKELVVVSCVYYSESCVQYTQINNKGWNCELNNIIKPDAITYEKNLTM